MENEKHNISQFHGITIQMQARERFFPNIYALYEDEEAMFSLGSGNIIDGSFPEEQRKLVTAWIQIHQKDLLNDWEQSLKHNVKPRSIPGLT